MRAIDYYDSVSRPFIVIFESELKAIASMALAAGSIETGGDLYGLFSHARRPVVFLAVPAGPNAIHDHAHFRQDIDYIKQVSAELRDKWAIQYLGNHHSHHNLGIKGLSGGDIRSTHSIAGKNGYANMCQLLVTFDDGSSRQRFWQKSDVHWSQGQERLERWRPPRDKEMEPEAPRLVGGPPTVHAFYYEVAAGGQPLRCPIKVLPGISPIRTALGFANAIPGKWTSHHYPLSKIQFDDLEHCHNVTTQEPVFSTLPDRFLEHIRSQVVLLPTEIKENIHIKKSGEGAVIRIPLDEYKIMILAMSTHPPHEIYSVMIGNKNGIGEPQEITDQVINKTYMPTIGSIHRLASRMAKAGIEEAKVAMKHHQGTALGKQEIPDTAGEGRKGYVESVPEE